MTLGQEFGGYAAALEGKRGREGGEGKGVC